MTLDPRQLQRERRVTATHEAIHAERGHNGCQPEAIELSVRKETARRCITIYALVDAILFYGETDLFALADDLWCLPETVQTRKDHLHPAERGYIRQRLAARDGSA